MRDGDEMAAGVDDLIDESLCRSAGQSSSRDPLRDAWSVLATLGQYGHRMQRTTSLINICLWNVSFDSLLSDTSSAIVAASATGLHLRK